MIQRQLAKLWAAFRLSPFLHDQAAHKGDFAATGIFGCKCTQRPSKHIQHPERTCVHVWWSLEGRLLPCCCSSQVHQLGYQKPLVPCLFPPYRICYWARVCTWCGRIPGAAGGPPVCLLYSSPRYTDGCRALLPSSYGCQGKNSREGDIYPMSRTGARLIPMPCSYLTNCRQQSC